MCLMRVSTCLRHEGIRVVSMPVQIVRVDELADAYVSNHVMLHAHDLIERACIYVYKHMT